MVKGTGTWVLFIAVAGAALRIALAFWIYPWTGDPTYSYAYRGLLLADGQWHAAFQFWHPPGYPLLLGLLTKLSGSLISPYVWGTIVSIVCYFALVIVIDRLVAPRTHWPSTRIAVASFLALYETLFIWATGPLTEPLYLFLLFAAVWIVDRERMRPARSFFMGGLLGLACTMRLEGLAPFFGLVLFVSVRATRGPGRFREAAGVAASATLGLLATFGWLLFFPEYLKASREVYQGAVTIPPAQGVAGNLVRFAECAYHACTVWLPFALLLPYWVFLAIGLTHPACAAGKASLHGLLLAVTVPSLVVVTLSVMHKRTASFLFPAAGVWFGLGLEVVAARLALDRTRRGLAVLLCMAILLNLSQATRILYNLRRSSSMTVSNPASYVAARLLSEQAAEVGPVWAFKSEPEVYAFWGQPLYCSVWDGDKGYSHLYAQNQHNPEGFVDELRGSGFKYLTFVLSDKPKMDISDIEPQQYAQPYHNNCYGAPLRSDLCALMKNCKENGLQLLGERAGNITILDEGTRNCKVYLFRILHR
jgi:hypothetical protein